jgi:hypothetical protein
MEQIKTEYKRFSRHLTDDEAEILFQVILSQKISRRYHFKERHIGPSDKYTFVLADLQTLIKMASEDGSRIFIGDKFINILNGDLVHYNFFGKK